MVRMAALPIMRHLCLVLLLATLYSATAETVLIPGGEYRSLFARVTDPAVIIHPVRMDISPVSNAHYQQFLRDHSKWQKDQVSSLFADKNYLQHWQDGSAINRDAPVVHVSWFSANAYCRAQGGRLPTTAEWEWAALSGQAKQSVEDRQAILDWYAKPNRSGLPSVKSAKANAFGLHDMHGVVWEWTEDFNATMSTGESRNDSAIDNQFFCGSASAGSADPGDYATFMRYALRASLSAHYTLPNLGFRCVYDGSSSK